MQDGLEVWPGTSGCYTGFDRNLRIYCPAASHSSIGFTPSLLVVWESWTSTVRQHRTVYVRPYPSHPQRWSGWISWGLISKLASHWLLGETFSSLRYQSSSSNKTIFMWKQEFKIRELCPQSPCALQDALNMLKHWCYHITVQSGCRSQSAFLKNTASNKDAERKS